MNYININNIIPTQMICCTIRTNIIELANDIKINGLEYSIIVTKIDEKFYLINGYHRFLAVILNGIRKFLMFKMTKMKIYIFMILMMKKDMS